MTGIQKLILVLLLLAAIVEVCILLRMDRPEPEPNQQTSAELSEAERAALLERLAADAEYGDVLQEENEIVKPKTKVDLRYAEHPLSYTYFVVGTAGADLLEAPSEDSAVKLTVSPSVKLDYLKTVIVKGKPVPGVQVIDSENGWTLEIWYLVSRAENGTKTTGFVRQGVCEKRFFSFVGAEAALAVLDRSGENTLSYVYNYKNYRGRAPAYHGGNTDTRGNGRSMSAPGYMESGLQGEFVYLADGILLKVPEQDEQGQVVKVQTLDSEDVFYMPRKYLKGDDAVSGITKAVVIDRRQQNEMVYEKENGKWTLISCTLATTGRDGTYSRLTPLGYYAVDERKDEITYLKDGTTVEAGYAPYALRFTGGAYIHGVPQDYQWDVAGNRIKPAMTEYSELIGTVPLSHKCVRNYTSHAKFLYDWFEAGKTAVIVIESAGDTEGPLTDGGLG